MKIVDCKYSSVEIGLIVTICSLLLVMFAFLGLPIYNQRQNGPCILTIPYGEIEESRIYPGGLFGSGNLIHDLSYPGTYQHSGKKCSVWVGVTEGEYERQMYGVKR